MADETDPTISANLIHIRNADTEENAIALYESEAWRVERVRIGKVGLQVAEEVATDPKAMATARTGAARLLLEVSGFLATGRAAASQNAKEPASMSTSELKALVAKLDGEIAGRATLVEPSGHDTTQDIIDIIG